MCVHVRGPPRPWSCTSPTGALLLHLALLLAAELGIHSDPRLCSQDLQEVGEVVLARDQAVLG